jgi:hypothetical protein
MAEFCNKFVVIASLYEGNRLSLSNQIREEIIRTCGTLERERRKA